ncbi:MAG: GIY-YIG nuclease family protein [Chromatiales bacterium]|nr:GIY-YIG nuclease family protein [Gammaproteobacteria bacterium]
MNEPADFWHVYILKCCDGSLYTGIAKDVVARVKKHNSGQGAKYTRGRLPVELLYTESVGPHGEALRREMEIKRMSAANKNKLVYSG